MRNRVFSRVFKKPQADQFVHNELKNLNAGDYQHLTVAEKAALLSIVDVESSVDLSEGSTITLDMPENAILIGAKFFNSTTIGSGDGATDWQADLSGGSDETLVDAMPLTDGEGKVWAGIVKLFGTTQVAISSATGTLNSGTIFCTARYIAPMAPYAT